MSEVPLYTHLNILDKHAAGVPHSGQRKKDSCTCRVDGGVPRSQEHTPISPNAIIDIKRARMETGIDNILTLPFANDSSNKETEGSGNLDLVRLPSPRDQRRHRRAQGSIWISSDSESSGSAKTPSGKEPSGSAPCRCGFGLINSTLKSSPAPFAVLPRTESMGWVWQIHARSGWCG